MAVFKKLIFALPFFLSFALFISLVSTFLQNPNQVLSPDLNNLEAFIFIICSLLTTGLFFAIFVTLANSDWKFITPVTLLAVLLAFIFTPPIPAIIIAVGSLISFLIINLSLGKKLASYLSFEPSKILAPSIKHISTLLILILSFAFYLTTSADIQKYGFTPPSSLIDIALKFLPQNLTQNLNSNIQISPDQISLLEQNPDLLKPYGLDITTLEALKTENPNRNLTGTDLIKPFISNQIKTVVAPYQNFIPIILTALFLITLLTFSSILSAFLPLFLLIIFYLLKATNIIHFEIETREVNKLVV